MAIKKCKKCKSELVWCRSVVGKILWCVNAKCKEGVSLFQKLISR